MEKNSYSGISTTNTKEEFSNNNNNGLSLAGELQQGKEFARQLQNLLNNPHSLAGGGGGGRPEFLVHQIIASFDRAVAIAHHSDQILPVANKSDSPVSGGAVCSPGSEDSDPVGEFLDTKTTTRNIKGQARRKVIVPVSAETGFEGPPSDGYNWRKYGQKEILNAEYSRAYYRCALKNHTNCSATKQVQRCDKDPSTFEVNYRGHHTCNQPVINPTHPPPSSSNPNAVHSHHANETLISFNPQHHTTNPCFILQQNTDFHNHQTFPASNPNSFHFPGPTSATSAVPAVAPSGASATSSPPMNITQDFPFESFDFDPSEFFP